MTSAAPSSPLQAVSIIGVGNMGGGMATNLLSRGYTVYAHDMDNAKTDFFQRKGAIVQVSIAQAAIKSIVSIVCVVDAVQTHDLLFGAQNMAQQLPLGHTVMLCPTISPQDTELCSAKLAQLGVHMIEAPMSGGPARAADGTMSLMVACTLDLFQRHQQLLKDLSSKLFHISERTGDGARTKLVNNLLAGINLVGAAEVMVLAKRMGLDLETTLNVIEQSSGQSWIGSDRMRRVLAADYEPRAPLAHMALLAKDTALAVSAAHSLNLGQQSHIVALGQLASTVFGQAMQSDCADQDDSALFKFLQTQSPA